MFETAPVLMTSRLRLRPHRREDFEPLVRLYRTERARFIGGPLSEKDVWRSFMCDVGQWPILGFGSWAVELAAGGALVGQVGINRPAHFPETEIGWLLFDGHEGHSYAVEAAARARQFAAAVAGIDQLVSYIDPDNLRSIRVAERLGAVRDPAAPTPENDACLVFRHPPLRQFRAS